MATMAAVVVLHALPTTLHNSKSLLLSPLHSRSRSRTQTYPRLPSRHSLNSVMDSMGVPFPHPCSYAAIQLDPVASVEHLDDEKALAAARSIRPKTYLVYIVRVSLTSTSILLLLAPKHTTGAPSALIGLESAIHWLTNGFDTGPLFTVPGQTMVRLHCASHRDLSPSSRGRGVPHGRHVHPDLPE